VFRHTKAQDGSPLVNGKSATGFSNSEEAAIGLTHVVPFRVEDMLKKNGGLYSKADNWKPHVVVDGNLTTGQNPASAEGGAKALLRQLSDASHASSRTIRSVGGINARQQPPRGAFKRTRRS
jgi:putative intracellular protease/amidase